MRAQPSGDSHDDADRRMLRHMLAVADPDLWHLLLLPIIGLLAGALGGLLGVGGGVIMIPALILAVGVKYYGPDSLHLYKLASLFGSVVLSAPAAWRHLRARAIVWPIVRAALPFALLGVAAGVLAASFLVQDLTPVLRQMFGGFLLLVVVSDFVQRRLRRKAAHAGPSAAPVARRWGVYGPAIGLMAGLISGLLGVGGGVWIVPVQTLVLGVRLRNSIANSATLILAITTVATILQTFAVAEIATVDVRQGWVLAVWMAPGAAIGGLIGAALTHRMRGAWLQIAFQLLLAVTGLRLLGVW